MIERPKQQREPTKGERTRSRILSAALEVFGKKGYEATTLQMIADRAEVHKPGLIHYFADKADLFRTCLDEVLAFHASILEGEIRTEEGPLTRLEKSVRSNLTLATRSPNRVRLMIHLYSFGASSPEFGPLSRDVFIRVRERYSVLIAEGVKVGVFDLEKGKKPLEVAEVIHDAIIGSMIRYGTFPMTDEASQTLRRKWGILLSSVLGTSKFSKT